MREKIWMTKEYRGYTIKLIERENYSKRKSRVLVFRALGKEFEHQRDAEQFIDDFKEQVYTGPVAREVCRAKDEYNDYGFEAIIIKHGVIGCHKL